IRQLHVQLESLLSRQGLHRGYDVFYHLLHLHWLAIEDHLPGLQLGDIQEVVDDPEHETAGLVEPAKKVGLLLGLAEVEYSILAVEGRIAAVQTRLINGFFLRGMVRLEARPAAWTM